MTDRAWVDRLLDHAASPIDDDDTRRVIDLVIDTVAVAAGARQRHVGAAGLDASAMNPLPNGPAHVWGGAGATTPMQAAFLNGTAAEALDFQEVMIAGRTNGHAAVVIVPALIALAQDRGIAGPRLVQAFNIAFVANLMLLRALGRGHRAGAVGFRTTSLGAPIAAALGGGHLVGLSRDQTAHAVAIAASALPAGLLAAMSPLNGSYSDDKDVAIGLGAQHAVQSVLLAEANATGPASPITGHRGWLASYGFDTAQPDVLAQTLPEHAVRAYAIKRYPANFGCQAVIRAALALRGQTTIDEIDAVHIRVKTSSAQSLSTKNIVNHLAARFSLAYAVASALARGRCVLDDFEPPALNDPTVLKLIDRCTIEGDAALEAIHQDRGIFPGHVSIRRTDGAELQAGHEGPWDGVGDAERSAGLAAKLHDLLGNKGTTIAAELQRIGEVEGLQALNAALNRLSTGGAVVAA